MCEEKSRISLNTRQCSGFEHSLEIVKVFSEIIFFSVKADRWLCQDASSVPRTVCLIGVRISLRGRIGYEPLRSELLGRDLLGR